VRRPRFDPLGLALGLGLGAVLASTTVLLSGLPYSSLPVRVALVVPILVAPFVAGSVPDLGPRLARSRLSVVFAFVPTTVLLGAALALSAGLLPFNGIGMPAFVALVLVAVAGFVLYAVAEHRLAKQVRERESPLIEWRAGAEDGYRRRVRVATVASGLALVAAGLVLAFTVRGPFTFLPAFGAALAAQGFVIGRDKEFAAYESGLVVKQAGGVGAAFVPWDRFAGYERTDDALVCRRWIPLGSVYCALDDLDDPEEVERVLERRLG